MAKHVEISDRGMSRFNSLEFTGYRYEMIGRKPENFAERQLKRQQQREYKIQEYLSDIKKQEFSDLNLNATLKGEEKRITNNEKRSLKIAARDQTRLQQTLNESRKKALQKLLCDDFSTYEAEFQSLGKSIYKHYK